eukprot:TRINITY_DN10857_c0_g1_i1.p1 TRINITY_DN10857_c0_g1~~TRINITY_DN10857_c0_g1_i1.p1  ORF type:complete len:356 (-),score=81.86 TRINITY_DN10857_c0_g1_i1:380-1375(-)
MADIEDEHFAQEEAKFEKQYEVVDKTPIGEGTYGKVYKARTSDGSLVAMKKMKLDSEEEGVPSTAIREIALLKELQHDNVVRLVNEFCSMTKLTLVFEYLENDLKKYMKSKENVLPEDVVRRLSYQLCKGIGACHAFRILHRDIKPQNLLIDHQGTDGTLRLKIADFGLARVFTVPVPKYTHEVVTVWYRAPEILLGSALYSIPVDLWSVGCVIAEMASGAPLFPGDSEIDTIFKMFQKLGTPTLDVWPGLKDLPDFKKTFPTWPNKGWAGIRNIQAKMGGDGVDLLTQIMQYNPPKRLSARQAVMHPYFASLHDATPPTLQPAVKRQKTA